MLLAIQPYMIAADPILSGFTSKHIYNPNTVLSYQADDVCMDIYRVWL